MAALFHGVKVLFDNLQSTYDRVVAQCHFHGVKAVCQHCNGYTVGLDFCHVRVSRM